MSSTLPSAPPLRRVPAAVLVLAVVTACGAAIHLGDGRSEALLAAGALGAAMLPVLIAAATLRARGPAGITLADAVTLTRYAAAGILGAAAVLALAGDVPARDGVLVVLAALSLATDGIDGAIARRRGTAGPIGARVDVEADAVLVLMLSLLAATVVGPWVLLIGAMRYLYVAASWFRPALRRPLTHSQARRIIGLTQGVVLVVALVPAVPVPLATGVVGIALILLCWSFGRDILRQETEQRQEAWRDQRIQAL